MKFRMTGEKIADELFVLAFKQGTGCVNEYAAFADACRSGFENLSLNGGQFFDALLRCSPTPVRIPPPTS